MTANRLSLFASILAVVVGGAAFAGGAPVSRAGTTTAASEAPSGEPSAPPSSDPSAEPTAAPSAEPTAAPSAATEADPTPAPRTAPPTPAPTDSPAPTPTASPSPTASPTPTPVPRSDTLRLRRLAVIRGSISPKSVVATQTGLVFAQNMMYRHTMTVYNRRGQLVKTISDRVVLSRYGFPAYPVAVNGAPVEAAVAPDGRHMYVSQYSMYGPGFAHPGWDTGWVNDVIDRSFVYEISTTTLRITRIIRVGPVPKAVGVSPTAGGCSSATGPTGTSRS